MMNLPKQFFRKGLFALLICMGIMPLSVQVHAQSVKTQKVTGRVSNQKGELLQGVSVLEVGTSNGTSTDERGTYEIMVSGEEAQLEFTYVGYKPKTMAVPKRGVLDVALDEIVASGEEVVVVGFGTQKKASVVGSITTIAPRQLQLTPNRSLSNNLAGMVPGVIAVQRSGDPWANNSDFWIRGVSTLTNSRPLVLIDGVERSLNDIDPEEMESFSILKDAAASAVYGVRGANGVIMITTKRGKIGPPVVSVRFEGTNTSPVKLPNYIGSVKYIELMNELAADAGKTPLFSEDDLQKFRDQSDPELYPDVNWWKVVAKDHASNTRTNLNMAGGNDFLRYALELGYFDEKGFIRRDSKQEWNSELRVKRYNVRSNIDLNVTRTTLVRVSLGGFLQTRNGPPGDETNFGIFYQASRIPPFIHHPQYSTGEIPRVSFRENPWAWATQRGFEKWNNYSLQSLTAVEQDLKAITPGLKAKLTFSFDKFSGNSVVRSKNPDYYNPASGRDADGNLILTIQGRGNEFLGYSTNSLWGNQAVYLEGMVSYNRVFNNKHDINSMLLYNQRDYDTGEKTPFRTQGIAGRFSYTYDRRYIAEANFGYNGSENFAPGKRYGFFPAFAAGWIISQEAFMEPVRDVISNLKLRGSWGMAGNSEIGGNRRFAYLSTIADFNYYRWGVNNDYYRLGRSEGEVGVPDLTWETAVKQNIGFELGLLKGAINFNIDLFKEDRSDIFITRNNVPGSAGFIRSIWANFGKVVNKGVEMSLTADKQLSQDWHVSMMANYTYARNKRTEIDEPMGLRGTYRSQTGMPVGQLRGLIAEGLFTNDDFNTDGSLKLGIPVPAFSTTVRPGDIRYRDLNNDGEINSFDVTNIGGTRMPEIIYGFGATIKYKIVDLGFFFQGAGRTWQILGGENWLPGTSSGATGNIYSNIDDRWTPDNPSQDVFWPRLNYGVSANNEQASTWWLKDMSFLRLKNLELGVTVPKQWSKTIWMSNVRAFVRGSNILTLSSFKLWDPELETTDGLKYPIMKSYSVGININF